MNLTETIRSSLRRLCEVVCRAWCEIFEVEPPKVALAEESAYGFKERVVKLRLRLPTDVERLYAACREGVTQLEKHFLIVGSVRLSNVPDSVQLFLSMVIVPVLADVTFQTFKHVYFIKVPELCTVYPTVIGRVVKLTEVKAIPMKRELEEKIRNMSLNIEKILRAQWDILFIKLARVGKVDFFTCVESTFKAGGENVLLIPILRGLLDTIEQRVDPSPLAKLLVKLLIAVASVESSLDNVRKYLKDILAHAVTILASFEQVDELVQAVDNISKKLGIAYQTLIQKVKEVRKHVAECDRKYTVGLTQLGAIGEKSQ